MSGYLEKGELLFGNPNFRLPEGTGPTRKRADLPGGILNGDSLELLELAVERIHSLAHRISEWRNPAPGIVDPELVATVRGGTDVDNSGVKARPESARAIYLYELGAPY